MACGWPAEVVPFVEVREQAGMDRFPAEQLARRARGHRVVHPDEARQESEARLELITRHAYGRQSQVITNALCDRTERNSSPAPCSRVGFRNSAVGPELVF